MAYISGNSVLRLAGSAVNWVTPLAGIGGEVVKVLLLESTMPRAQAAAAVVIDKASFLLAQIVGSVPITGTKVSQ
jgi:hypothetical protein